MKIGPGVSELWEVENRPLPLTRPMAYTTACTTVQAVILFYGSAQGPHLISPETYQILIVGCPGTQSFQLYANVSSSVPIGGYGPRKQFWSECQAVR